MAARLLASSTALSAAADVQVVDAWTEAIFMMIELLPGHPSAKMLRLPQQKGGKGPRRLWGSSQRKQSNADLWPIE